MTDKAKHLSVWLEKLRKHPLSALEDCKASYARTTSAQTERLYESIGFMVAFVRHLQQEEVAMNDFRNHRFWADNARATSSNNLSILAARFLLGVGEAKGSLYEQARSYAKVVDFFLQENTEPSAIPGFLKRKTIYGLLDQIANDKTKGKRAVAARNTSDASDGSMSSDRSDSDEGEVSSASDADSEDNGEQDSSGVAKDHSGPSPATKRKGGVSNWGAFTKRAKEIEKQGKIPVLAAMKPKDWAKLVRYLEQGRVNVVCSGAVGEDEWVEVICDKVSRSDT